MTDTFFSIHSFLQKYKTTEEEYTHVSLIYPKGKYLIKDEDCEKFWNIYNKDKNNKGLCELASYTNNLPILVDIDLKKEMEEKIELNNIRVLYTLDHVKQIINIYQRVLRDIIENLDERHLVCLLLEKIPYYSKKNLKNGFHLHFPFIFLDKLKHESDLIPRIRLEIKKLDKTSELPSCFTEQSLDRCYIRNPWLLYGSGKDGGMPYKITCALDEKGRVIEEWSNVLENYQIFDIKNQRIHIDISEIDEYLPRILSIYNQGRKSYIYEIKKNLPTFSNHGNKKSLSLITNSNKENSINIENTMIDLVDNLMNCLKDSRADDRNEWIQIGWILYNIFKGNKTGYNRWIEFSKRSVKFQETVCIYEWNRMLLKDISIASLKYLARDDNEILYNEIMKEYTESYIDRSLKLDGTHHDLAMALYEKYDSIYICASMTHKIWFEFKDHIWTKIDAGYTLSQKISSELVERYEEINKSIYKKILDMTCTDEENITNEKKKIKAVQKMIKNLKSNPFKTNIMKECMETFYRNDFLAKLDCDPYLIAFKNGVYDIKNHVFREGRPTDYLSLKMNINYHDHYKDDGKEIREIEHYFMQIFPDEELRDYFLDSSAEIFIGGNFNKVVQIWSGEGNNGKSITQSIFEQMLGPYNVKLPTALITGKRTQSSAANPELVRAGNGVRFAMIQEPDQKDTVNIGILKELSGNDTFFARGLYKEGQEINPMFKLVLICNEPPKLTYSDKAAWNRIKMIPFESTFTQDAPDDWDEQLKQKKFPMDLKFRDKIPRMIEPLAYYLLKRLKEKPETKKLPLKVTLATENYKKKNDIYKQYLDEWIEYQDNKFCNSSELYISFREWQKESCPNHTCPDRNEFIDYVVRLWGKMDTKDGWFGRFIRGPVDYN